MDRIFGSDRLIDDAMPEQDRIGLALAVRTTSSEIAEERKASWSPPAEPAQLKELRHEGRYEETTPGAPKDHPPVDSASERQATVRGTDCRLCQDGRAAERGRIRPQPSRSASENHGVAFAAHRQVKAWKGSRDRAPRAWPVAKARFGGGSDLGRNWRVLWDLAPHQRKIRSIAAKVAKLFFFGFAAHGLDLDRLTQWALQELHLRCDELIAALAPKAIAQCIRSDAVWEAESNRELLSLVSAPAAADGDASFTVERINL
jgi:hypothetical protein